MNHARSPIKRPPRWALSNWPVRVKVVAIVVVPLLLAGAFGGLRIHAANSSAQNLRVAAARADMVPAVGQYLASVEAVLVSATDGGDVPASVTAFESQAADLQRQLAAT
ncbi:MAG: hypothetical protein PGN37_26060, partial [Mycobacterium kyogaense]